MGATSRFTPISFVSDGKTYKLIPANGGNTLENYRLWGDLDCSRVGTVFATADGEPLPDPVAITLTRACNRDPVGWTSVRAAWLKELSGNNDSSKEVFKFPINGDRFKPSVPPGRPSKISKSKLMPPLPPCPPPPPPPIAPRPAAPVEVALATTATLPAAPFPAATGTAAAAGSGAVAAPLVAAAKPTKSHPLAPPDKPCIKSITLPGDVSINFPYFPYNDPDANKDFDKLKQYVAWYTGVDVNLSPELIELAKCIRRNDWVLAFSRPEFRSANPSECPRYGTTGKSLDKFNPPLLTIDDRENPKLVKHLAENNCHEAFTMVGLQKYVHKVIGGGLFGLLPKKSTRVQVPVKTNDFLFAPGEYENEDLVAFTYHAFGYNFGIPKNVLKSHIPCETNSSSRVIPFDTQNQDYGNARLLQAAHREGWEYSHKGQNQQSITLLLPKPLGEAILKSLKHTDSNSMRFFFLLCGIDRLHPDHMPPPYRLWREQEKTRGELNVICSFEGDSIEDACYALRNERFSAPE